MLEDNSNGISDDPTGRAGMRVSHFQAATPAFCTRRMSGSAAA
jgi:hypothetical protein